MTFVITGNINEKVVSLLSLQKCTNSDKSHIAF